MKLFKKTLDIKILIMAIMVFIFLFVLYFILNVFTHRLAVVSRLKDLTNPIITLSPVLSELPIRIEIPNIGINSIVEHIGLTKDGFIGSPVGPNSVAWFSEGPIPGLIGNSIINGHSGWKNNIPAVFDNLKKLKKGDKIYVENGAGRITIFVVRELKTYDKDDVALDVFNSDDDKPHLNLITCTGVWNVFENSSDSRIVVFTDLLESKN